MERILFLVWPIKREEASKFFPMALMLLLTIFNYNTLKAMKDSFIVPNIGAEAVSFVKFYFVFPSAVLFVLLYIKMSNVLKLSQIYCVIGSFFLVYFLLFGFIFYPHQLHFHPDPQHIQKMIGSEIDIFGINIKLHHFKWFFLIYGKWLYIVFYVLAELWGSAMTFLLFWQFSNQITPTDQAKRFYPMLNLFGSVGTFISGTLIQYVVGCQDVAAKADESGLVIVQTLLAGMSGVCVVILLVFLYLRRVVLADVKYVKDKVAIKEIKTKLPFMESLRLILSSRYLGYIVILVLSYGIAINLLEGPWKAKVREIHQCTRDYINFMGQINQWNGLLAVVFSLIGVSILRYYSWFVAAIITPIMIFSTGIIFFTFVVFDNYIASHLRSYILIDPLTIAVLLGSIQNILSKSSKYGLFDPTKEMTYIPIEPELKSKGKAAVDVIGARFAKSGGAFIQTTIFVLFPAATYASISPILMLIFLVVAIIWVLDVKVLNREYLKYLSKG